MNKEDLNNLLLTQKKAFRKDPPDYKKRMHALKLLSEIVDANTEKLKDAVSKDFGSRAREETQVLEIFPLYDEISHARKNLKAWMKRQ